MFDARTHKLFRVKPGSRVRLIDYDPAWAGAGRRSEAQVRRLAERSLQEDLAALSLAQERLYAGDVYSLLVIFQALDAAGKDGTIKHVMSGVNPQGCQVFAFKAPSAEELDHTFLWRCMKALPERGRIGIFNRSYYEEALVVRVHPELLAKQHLPEGKRGAKFWRARFDDINAFERHLVRNGTRIVKFYLNVSKAEQRRRFLERIDDPKKNWKFSPQDVAERARWDDYIAAYEAVLSATSTRWAPWYVIPADKKFVARALVADILTATIGDLDLKFPEPTPEQRQALAAARRQLVSEGGDA